MSIEMLLVKYFSQYVVISFTQVAAGRPKLTIKCNTWRLHLKSLSQSMEL